MKTIRIGNDIHIEWKIYSRDGSPLPLGRMTIRLFLLSGPLRKQITDFSISGNVVLIAIEAKDITRFGIYRLVLSVIDSESQSPDATFDATTLFQIVRKDGERDDVADEDILISTSTILNNIVASAKNSGVTLSLCESGHVYPHNLGHRPSVSVQARVVEQTSTGVRVEYRDVLAEIVHVDDNSVRIEYRPSPLEGWVYFV